MTETNVVTFKPKRKRERVKLTDTVVRALKPRAERYDVFDMDVKGFHVRVFPSGAKTFRLLYKLNGERKPVILGDYPATPVARAREAAMDGRDSVRREQKHPQRARATGPTFGLVADRFLASPKFAAMADSTRLEAKRIVEVELRPVWGSRVPSTITRDEIKTWGAGIVRRLQAKGGKGHLANRAHEYMRLMWNWAANEDGLGITSTPFVNLAKPLPKEEPSDRVLKDAEVRRVFDGIKSEPTSTAAWWLTLFLTATRKTEALLLEKTEVDQEKKGGVWIIPKEKTKSRRPLVLPLTKPFKDVLALAVPFSGDSPYVFAGRNEGSHRDLKSGKAGYRMRERTGVNFSPHDVRRTVASGMGEIGVDPVVIDRILNHRVPTESRTTTTYNVHYEMWAHFDEKADALKRWVTHLDKVILKGKLDQYIAEAISER